jgi:hypothetical protein
VTSETNAARAPERCYEQPVTLIPIALDINKAQISGLAWYGDHLIILPQYPNWQGTPGDGQVEVLMRGSICDFLDGKSDASVTPRHVPLLTEGLDKKIKGFEGFEAIVVTGDKVYLTVEAEPDEANMAGYVVAGTIAPDMSEIRLDPGMLVEIPPQAQVENASYETLVLVGDKLMALYEANGVNVNPNPIAYLFDLSLNPLGSLPFPNVEYRITDATPADAEGRFWAMNYFWPGDTRDYRPGPDPLVTKYGKGPTHTHYGACERLVQLRYTPQGIVLTDTPPIQLQLLDVTHSRNWEGLVELDGRGFLIITDEFPETLLGYVAAPST